jgi:hypothetical protein
MKCSQTLITAALVGTMGWHHANLANGASNEMDWVAYDDFSPRSAILTPKQEVTYVMAFPDIEKTAQQRSGRSKLGERLLG